MGVKKGLPARYLWCVQVHLFWTDTLVLRHRMGDTMETHPEQNIPKDDDDAHITTEGGSDTDTHHEAEDENDVFEIIDFTTASPWECLAADIEKHLRGWGLAEGAEERSKGNSAKSAQMVGNQEAIVDMRGRAYTLRYINCVSQAVTQDTAVEVHRGSSKISVASVIGAGAQTSSNTHRYVERTLHITI